MSQLLLTKFWLNLETLTFLELIFFYQFCLTLTKHFCWTKICFWTNIFLAQDFFWIRIIFLTKNFLDQKILEPKNFCIKFFCIKKFFESKFFLEPKSFLTKNVFWTNFLWQHFFGVPWKDVAWIYVSGKVLPRAYYSKLSLCAKFQTPSIFPSVEN